MLKEYGLIGCCMLLFTGCMSVKQKVSITWVPYEKVTEVCIGKYAIPTLEESTQDLVLWNTSEGTACQSKDRTALYLGTDRTYTECKALEYTSKTCARLQKE